MTAVSVSGSDGASVFLGAQDVLAGSLGAGAVGEIAGVVVDPAAVAAQALGDVLGRIVEGAVRVGGFALAAERQPTAGMDVDVAGEEAASSAEGDMSFLSAVEIFACNNIELI